MNVILYSLEATKSKSILSSAARQDRKFGIRQLITSDLLKNSGNSTDYLQKTAATWQNIPYDNLRLIRPVESLLGAFFKSNVSIFVFEQTHRDLPASEGEITLNIVAYSPIGIEDIFEVSFAKLRDVFSGRKIKLLTHSSLLLFPFDKGSNDIFSTDLKVRACFLRPVLLEKKDSIKLIVVLGLTIALYALDAAMSSNGSSLKLAAVFVQNILTLGAAGSDSIYKILWGACLAYVIFDFFLLSLIPWVFTRKAYSIKVDNLASVIEDRDRALSFSEQVDAQPKLARPPVIGS